MMRQKIAEKKRPRAVASHAHNLEKHVEPFFGKDRDVRSIRRPDLEAFKRHLSTDLRLGAVTVNNQLTTIRQVLKQAAVVEEMPGFESMPLVANVKVPKGTKGRALTEDQVVSLLDQVNPRELEAQQFLEFCVNTGTRKTETLAMKWGWIDWDARMMRIPPEYRKGGEDRRRVPLNDAAMDILVSRRDHGTKYTGRRKDPLPTGPEDRVWIQKKHDVSRNAAAQRAGLGRVRTHDLRHTFGSLAVKNGASLTEVRDLLGHQTMTMVNHYQHSYEQQLREASQRVQIRRKSVLGSVSGEGQNGAENGPNQTQSIIRKVK
jgi:integrase